MFLIITIFIVPLGTGLYLWREGPPPRLVYYISLCISMISILLLAFATTPMMTFIGLGFFLASTSFFSGTYLSTLIRAYNQKKKQD